MPLYNSVVDFLQNISVEPMFILYHVSSALLTYSSTNMLLQKACHPNATSEPAYNTSCQDEIEAEKVIATINSSRPLLEYTAPVILLIVLFTWSDTHGKRRRPLCFVPLIGEIIASIFSIFSTYNWSFSPIITAAVQTYIRGATGGTICFMLGAITYISDITTVENRSWRIGLVTALTFLGTSMGGSIGGFLKSHLGFLNLFLVCTVLNTIALILGVLLMKNTACEDTKLTTFEGLFSPSLLITPFKTLFKKRSGNKRLVIWLSGFTVPLFAVSFFGESAVINLFLQDKFNMNKEEIEFYYIVFKLSVIFNGTYMAAFLLSKTLKCRDEIIGVLGNVTHIISSIAMCYVAYRWQLYAFALIGMLHGGVLTVGRSITSKIVDGNEFGQINSIFGVLYTIAPLAVFPAYNKVYTLTIDFMSGAIYLLNIPVAFISFILFVIIYMLQRKEFQYKSAADVNIESE